MKDKDTWGPESVLHSDCSWGHPSDGTEPDGRRDVDHNEDSETDNLMSLFENFYFGGADSGGAANT